VADGPARMNTFHFSNRAARAGGIMAACISTNRSRT
jgi:hypothetical protein